MVHCLIRSHHQQYKPSPMNDDAEGMCTSVASLEPDPRYSGCCSNIFRPGRVVRDLMVGSLVVLGVAVVVAVVFVVCFFFIPAKSEGEASLLGEESAFHGVPFEGETRYNGINEVEFHNSTRYDIDPMLERIKAGEHEGHDHGHEGHSHDHGDHSHDHDGHSHDHEGHKEHHHVGPVPEPNSEPEPEPEAEPEPEPEPTVETEPEAEATAEPEPESDHTHGKGPMTHDHTHPEMDHDHTHPDMDHDHTHPEMGHEQGPATHDHTHPEMDHHHTHLDMDHDHTHEQGPATHDHTHPEMDHHHTHSKMDHDHTHEQGPATHDHTHPEMDHHHTHPEMEHDHTHPEMDHDHTHPEMDHDHTHPEMDHDHTHEQGSPTHDHPHPAVGHEHTPEEGPVTHDHTHPEMDHDHTHPEMDNDHTHPAMDHEHTPGKGPVTHDHTHPEMDHDHTHPEMDHDHTHPADGTVEPAEPTMHHVPEASESEVTLVPATHEEREEGNLPPLFELFSPRTPTEEPAHEGSEGTLKELVIPHEHVSEDETHAVAEAHPEVLSPTEETHGITEAGAPEVPLGKCRPRQLEMCSDLPHALTAFPNWAGDHTEEDLHKTSLPFLRDVIVRSRCSPRAKEYSCAILEPPCTPAGTILPPCRTFCKSVASTCQEFITSRFSLSSAFDCEQFPDSSDPSVCFDMTNEPCLGLEHRCGDGRCVAKRLVCDGHSDCLDRSDEAVCPGQGSAEGGVPEETGFFPLHHLPDALQDGLRNEDSSPNSPLDPLAPLSEAQSDSELPQNRATQDHPASESSAPPFVLRPDEDYHTEYPEEGVNNVAVNANYPLENANDFTQPEPSTTPPKDVTLNPPFDPASFAVPSVVEKSCSQDEFECVDGSACLPSEAVCDGIQQCGDGSDEGDCQRVGCNTGEFQCATTGLCVPESWVCDGTDDCRDNSDETDCDLPPRQEPPSPHAGEAPHLENLTPLGQFPLPGGHLQDVQGGEEYNFNEFEGIQPNENSFVSNGNDAFPPIDVLPNGLKESHTRDYARELFPDESDVDTVVPGQEALVSFLATTNDTQDDPREEELQTYSDTGNSEPAKEGATDPGSTHLEDYGGYESRLPFDGQLQDFPQHPYQSDITVDAFPDNPSQHEFSQSGHLEAFNQGDNTPHTFPGDTHQLDQTSDNFNENLDQYEETPEETVETKQDHTALGEPQNYDLLNQPPYYESFGQITDHNQASPTQDEPQSFIEDELQASFRELPTEIGYKHPQLLAPEGASTLPRETSQLTPEETSPDYSNNNGETTVEAKGSEPTEAFHVQQGHLPQEPSQPAYEEESPYSQPPYGEEASYSPYQPFSGDNSPISTEGDQTLLSPLQEQETKQEQNEGHRASETVLNDEPESGVESEQTLKSIDLAVPIIDYGETPINPTTTTTTAPTPSRANRPRGSTRFAYSRRPFTRRPSLVSLRNGPPSSLHPGSQPTASSFHSRLQKWRNSRIPSYESLRTEAVQERLDTEEGDEEEPVNNEERRSRVTPKSRVPPFRRVPDAQRSYGPRPTLRTSRIDSDHDNYPQEFLKEGVKPESTFEAEQIAEEEQKVEEEVSEPAASVLTPVHIKAPSQRPSQWHPPPRMYRRDFLRANLELQRTRYDTKTVQTQDEAVSEHVGDNTDATDSDEPRTETLQFSHDSAIPDYDSSGYGSSDYQMHASNYPS